MNLDIGIHNDIPDEVYHADPCPTPSVSSSFLKKLLRQSPLHAYMSHPRLNQFHEPENKRCFDIGKAVHSVLLGAGAEIVEVYADDYRTNAAKDYRDEIYEEGKVPLLSKEREQVLQMVKSAIHQLKHHPEGQYFLGDGYSEQTAIWKERGIYHRSRNDRITLQRGMIFDYKTTGQSAHPDEFTRKIDNLDYDLSAAHYIEAERQLHGSEPEYRFIAQEDRFPFALSVIALTGPYLEVGRMKRARALSYAEWCLKHNKWPGYPSKTVYVDPPGYTLHKWIDEDGNPLSSNHEENKELFKIWGNALAPPVKEKT